MAERSRGLNIAIWVVTALLAILYVGLAGLGKLLPFHPGMAAAVEQFEHFGYSQAFRILIGVCEVAGGIGLLIPRLATLAAGGLMVIMVGAAYSHWAVGEPPLPPLIAFALLVFVGWMRRADLPPGPRSTERAS